MEETAAYQIEKLGYSRGDVRHIVLTHLHLDHAGGMRDFPKAQVHIYRTEYEAGMNPCGLSERAYDPKHWSHGPNWVVYDRADIDWYGFQSLRVVEELTPDIRLIPLPGHTRGHCGVAVATENGWLLQYGDAAAPYHPEADIHGLDQSKHTAAVLPGWFVRRLLGPNVPKLRELVRRYGNEVEVITAHDIYSFQKYQSIGQGHPLA